MVRKEHIKTFTTHDIEAMVANGESQTDWKKADALQGQIDPETDNFEWGAAMVGLPQRKKQLNIRLDAEVLDYFRTQGKGYQTRINAVLTSYVTAMKRQEQELQE